MKLISKMRPRIVGLSLALTLGLILNLSTGPIYGSPTSSMSIGGSATRASALTAAVVVAAARARYGRAGKPIEEITIGSPSNPAPTTYPGNALDR